jgi:hypothetical protein
MKTEVIRNLVDHFYEVLDFLHQLNPHPQYDL